MSIVLLSFLLTTTYVFAADVFATKQGKKYHKEICRFIKNRETTKLDEQEAVTKGLVKCGKCFADEQAALDKEVKK